MTSRRTRQLPSTRRQRGTTVIELLIGAAIGLFIVAAAAALQIAQLRDARSLLLQTRLTQELRNASDLIARDLRRAGYSGHAGAAPNPYAYRPTAIDPLGTLRYSMDATENDRVDVNEQFGFRLRGGAIEMLLGGSWQAVTDSNAITVSALDVAPQMIETAVASACPTQLQSRTVTIAMTAVSVADARIVRNLRRTVRVRADALADTACPT